MLDSDTDDYRTQAPRDSLEPIIRCIWRHRSSSTERRIERVPPDGCPELIFNLAAAYAEFGADGKAQVQPWALFAGQLTRPLSLLVDGPAETIGVRFRPDGARGFFGSPMTAATNKRIPLAALPGSSMFPAARLRTAPPDEQISLIEDFVERSPPPEPDPGVADAVERLSSDEIVADPPDGVSMRQLQRRFADRVGVSMREFRSIVRFRRIFDRIETRAGWAEAALAAGYFDQAQMAREFRRYLGCTASEWARQRLGLAASIAQEPMSQTYKRAFRVHR